MISKQHAAWLTEHAVDPEVANKLGVFTARKPSDLPEEFRPGLGKHLPGLVFPWRGANGHVEYQLHPDDPPVDGGRPRKYLFRSRKNGFTGCLWHGPADPGAKRVLLVEGTKQFLAAVCWAPPGSQVFGLAGVHMWQSEQVPVTDLAAMSGRDVFVIFDGDARTNRQVFDAGVSLREALLAEGANEVRFARLPSGDLDDLLAQRDLNDRPDFIARLVKHAKAKPADRRPRGTGRIEKGSEVLPDPSNPMAVARAIEPDWRPDGVLVRRFWRDDWYAWDGAGWVRNEERAVRTALYERTERATFKVEGESGTQLVPWSPNRPKLANLIDALASICWLPADIEPYTWLEGAEDPGTVVACSNGILRVDGRELLPADPRFFNLVSVPFEYNQAAECPAWREFLDQLWPDGGQGSVEALQEWFGYVLSGRTDLQKIMAIIGPKRAGKGTIARVLTQLVGVGNATGPSLYSLGTNFGLQPLIGKSLAVIADARLGGQANRELVVEQLLKISGEDSLSVDRKNKSHWEGKMSARLMLLSNELPRFADTSGTIASRFIALQLHRSWFDQEDLGLEEKLQAELPGILNWALDGLDRIGQNRRFTTPAEMEELTRTMRHTASPVSEFVESECVVGEHERIECERLWQAWNQWCLQQGRERTGTQAYFGRDLSSVVPSLRKVRGQIGNRRVQIYQGIDLAADEQDPDRGSTQPVVASESNSVSRPRQKEMSDLSDSSQSVPDDVIVTSQCDHLFHYDVDRDKPDRSDTASCPICTSLSDSVPPGEDDVIVRHYDVVPPARKEYSLSEKGKKRRFHMRNVGHVIVTYYDDYDVEEQTGADQGKLVQAGHELIFDVETGSADQLYSYGEGYVRLGGSLVGDRMHTEPGAGRILSLMRGARLIVGHNDMAFDLPALVEHTDLDFETIHEWAREGRLFDTLLAARQDDPPMAREKGVDFKRRYDMGSLAEQHGLGEKTDQLKALAKEYGGYDQIPFDDERYHEYLRNDLDVSKGLLEHYRQWLDDSYLRREHRVAAIAAQIRANGFRVDTDLLEQMVQKGNRRIAAATRYLHERYGVPLADEKGRLYKSPLTTKAGKAALVTALEQMGAGPVWRTAKSKDIELGRDAMQQLAAQNAYHGEVVKFCRAVMAITGTRAIYQTIADNLIGDRVHPEINLRQASGRWTYTGVNLAALGKRGERYHERDVFLPEPGEKILAVDLSQVDMRAVAGLSGDPNYIALFSGDTDAHTQIAMDLFGSEGYRQTAKQIGHGWNYGEAVRTIAERYEIDPKVVMRFDRAMKENYPALVLWQMAARERAESGGLLDNGFGRRMRPDPRRAWTQGPALEGQGAARDIMMEGLLRLIDKYPEVLPMLRTQVHDEIVLSVPEADVEDVRRAVTESLEFDWTGPGGKPVPIRADSGPAGDSWGHVYDQEK